MFENNVIKVLIVCSSASGQISGPYIEEQVISLRKKGVEIDFFLIRKKGVKGYLMSYLPFIKKILRSDYDIIHAHGGLSGLIASCQFIKPVVTTFHGSDINIKKNRKFSKTAYIFSRFSIFVNKEMPLKIGAKKHYAIIPCGTDFSVFRPLVKEVCREKLNLSRDVKIGLFAAGFDEPVKNYALAKIACAGIENLILLELKGYNREGVNLFLNACDFLLSTSLTEGSPQIIKEALACNCPIISTNVGDVKERIEGIEGCYVTDFNSGEISERIRLILNSGKRTTARTKSLENNLGMEAVANMILKIYKSMLNN